MKRFLYKEQKASMSSVCQKYSKGWPPVWSVCSTSAKFLIKKTQNIYYNIILQTTSFNDQEIKLYKMQIMLFPIVEWDIPSLQTQYLFAYAHLKIISSLLYFPSNTVHLSKQKHVHSI